MLCLVKYFVKKISSSPRRSVWVNIGSGNGLLTDDTTMTWTKYWLILWHSPEMNFTRRACELNLRHVSGDYYFQITTTSPMSQWANNNVTFDNWEKCRVADHYFYHSPKWSSSNWGIICYFFLSFYSSEIFFECNLLMQIIGQIHFYIILWERKRQGTKSCFANIIWRSIIDVFKWISKYIDILACYCKSCVS